MEVMIGGRKTGKTTLLIQRCAEAEAKGDVSYIVCHSHENAYALNKKAEEMGLKIRFPLTYAEFKDRQFAGQNIKKFFIDNVDILLQYMAGPVEVAMFTATANDDAS